MSPARHTTHNPRHGLGSRLGWREISTGGTTPMPDSAIQGLSLAPERTGELAPLTPFYSIIVPVVQFFGRSSFCHDNHGSFVYDSPNLFCGPSGSVRTGLTGVRSEPGHRTHLTSLISFSISNSFWGTKTINFKPRFDISSSQIFSGHSHQEKYKTKTKDRKSDSFIQSTTVIT